MHDNHKATVHPLLYCTHELWKFDVIKVHLDELILRG